METLIFMAVAGVVMVVVAAVIFNVIGSQSSQDSLATAQSLEAIFNEVANQSSRSGGNSRSPRYNDRQDPSSGRKNFSSQRNSGSSKKQNKNQRQANPLTTPTEHKSHNCDDVNYDNLDSLMGKSNSFNIAQPEIEYETGISSLRLGKDDLLRSFIMSEVLQRYDINRIYSRIPSARTDE